MASHVATRFPSEKQRVPQNSGSAHTSEPDLAWRAPAGCEDSLTGTDPIFLDDILTISIGAKRIQAEVVWTSNRTYGILYLNNQGGAAPPSLVEAWLLAEAEPIVHLDWPGRRPLSAAGPAAGITEADDGLVVDVTLETGRNCRGLARWPSGGMPTVQLFFRPVD